VQACNHHLLLLLLLRLVVLILLLLLLLLLLLTFVDPPSPTHSAHTSDDLPVPAQQSSDSKPCTLSTCVTEQAVLSTKGCHGQQ
jgi:hypothetical protein